MPVIGREIIAEGCSLVLGSSTAICACGIASLGLKTGFIGKLGKDRFGDVVLEELEKKSIDTSHVIISDKIKTGITISLSMERDRALVTHMGSIEELSIEDIDIKLLESTRHIHVGSFFLQHKLRPDLSRLFKTAHDLGATTSLDAGWDDTEIWNYGIFDVLKHTDIYFPNETEALNITKQDNVLDAVRILSDYSRITVVKCGSEGAVGKWGDSLVQQKTFDLKPIDTTGAGDSFNAGFIYGFLNGFELEKCLTYGNACGSISVTKIGGSSGCATLAEVEGLINR
jgi:sugar/nucleoside kinase (ribokinase family)